MTDPRTELPRDDVRPVVAAQGGGASTALIATGIGIAALTLFLVLNSHRTAPQAPAVRASAADRAAAVGQPAPPPLYVPPPPAVPPPEPVEIVPSTPVAPSAPPPRIVYVPQPAAPAPYVPPPAIVPQPVRETSASALVIDTTTGDGNPGATGDGPPSPNANVTVSTGSNAAPGARARATMLPARGTSVLQGTLIPAVLETALDSSRPGLARAIVSRDVRGFDGSRVLIPRGSRVTGEYRADTAQGQNRALIVWTRLVRPDGAAIALASPSADTLGRAGVKASVNSHFLARFAGAILQSVLQVGVNLASRSNNDTYVLGVGGSAGIVGGQAFNQNTQIPPTLKVRPGTSISVFVSRDLDFTAVEGRR